MGQSVTDVTIAAGATSILAAADWRTLGSGVYLKNEASVIITLTISGADTYALDPGEIVRVIPGQIITGTAVGGQALLQIIEGITPSDESASRGPGVSAADPMYVDGGGTSALDPLYVSAVISGATPNIPAGGPGMWSTGQDDFTAVWASGSTLTLGTFPTAMGTPIGGNFFLVFETLASGEQIAYAPSDYPMSLTGQVLTVTGAVFIEATSTFDVFAWGPPRGYDASVNGHQGRELSPLNAFTQNPELVNVTNETDSTIPYYVDNAGYKYGVFKLSLSCTAGTVTATLWGANDESVAQGAADYDDITLETVGYASLVATAGAASDDWNIDTPCPYKYLKVQIVYATGGDTGDARVVYRGIY